MVAIASAGVDLHHMLSEGHIAEGILWYSIAFLAIFWCWLNFEWYASAYDTDDTFFRITTFLQIFGALVFAFGVSNFFKPEHNFSIVIAQGTPWHPHHIAERYSLLVIIVLGEGIMATTTTIASLINDETRWQESFVLGFGAAALVFWMWWSYFKMPFGKNFGTE